MTVKFPPIPAFLLAAALAAAPGTAGAATQALALLETDRPTPLVCADGVCQAEFTSYCLQKDRPLPAAHAPYTPAADSDLQLLLTGADGGERLVPAAPHIRIAAARADHTAVTITLSQAALESLGARAAALAVGDRVTLLPVAEPGDPDPQRAAELQAAAGPLRGLGADMIDRAQGTVATVRVLNRLINALPEAHGRDDVARAGLWRKAMDAGSGANGPERRARAAAEFDACWGDRMVQAGGYGLRECLRRRHDALMWGETGRYWDAAGPAG